MKSPTPPPFDQSYADRQLELRIAHAAYMNPPANSITKVASMDHL